jgi:hypothetical protein
MVLQFCSDILHYIELMVLQFCSDILHCLEQG